MGLKALQSIVYVGLLLSSRARGRNTHHTLAIFNLLLAGECPALLKSGDVVPLIKEGFSIRPLTMLDPIFKFDALITRRLMRGRERPGGAEGSQVLGRRALGT